jgi:hypothetical protein
LNKALIRSARLVDVTASFAMEELKRSTSIPLPSKMQLGSRRDR